MDSIGYLSCDVEKILGIVSGPGLFIVAGQTGAGIWSVQQTILKSYLLSFPERRVSIAAQDWKRHDNASWAGEFSFDRQKHQSSSGKPDVVVYEEIRDSFSATEATRIIESGISVWSTIHVENGVDEVFDTLDTLAIDSNALSGIVYHSRMTKGDQGRVQLSTPIIMDRTDIADLVSGNLHK